MPRHPRIAPGGYVYHALNRGVARLALFEKPVKKRGRSSFRELDNPEMSCVPFSSRENTNKDHGS
jgi:hypothetical protein